MKSNQLNFVAVGEAGKRLNIKPRTITDALYDGILPDESCPIVGGRRMIPIEILPKLAKAIKARTRRVAEVSA